MIPLTKDAGSPILAGAMKRLLTAPLLILTAITAASQSPTPAPHSVLSQYFIEISGMYPRTEGSSGERTTIELIRRELDLRGLDYAVQSFDELPDNHSYSRTIDVRIAGGREDTLIVGVPLNHRAGVPASEDGAVNLALALSLIEHYASNPPPVGIRFLFLGAEKGEGRGYPIGTRVFLRDFYPQVPVACLYLDMARPAGSLRIVAGGGGTVSPPWLIGVSERSIAAAGLAFEVPPNMRQVYRLRVEDEPTAIGPFLAAGVAGVEITTPARAPTAPEGWEAAYLDAFRRIVEGLSGGLPEDWARHYLRIGRGPNTLTVGEQAYVLGLLVLLVASMTYGMVYRRRFGRYTKTIRRNFWNLPVYLALIFVFLLLATLLLRVFFLLRNMPSLWEAAPLSYFLMKVSLAVFLFSVWSQLVRALPFSKNGSFYSASALLFLFLDIVILAVINISLTYYFVWAFFFAFLFSVFRNRLLKAVSLVLSPIWLVKAAFDLLRLPELNMAETLLLSLVPGNLLLAFFTLPFMLMLIRMDYLIRHPIQGGRGFTLKLSTAASGFLTVAFVLYLVVHEPYGPENPQPIHAIELIDDDEETRRLELESPAPLGELLVLYGDRQYDVSSELRELFLPQAEPRSILDVTVSEERFLGRHRYTFTISPLTVRPSTVALRLTSPEEPFVVYNSTFPYALRDQSRTLEVFIGRNPPVPLEVGLTIAPLSALSLSLQLTSPETVEPIFIVGEHIVPVVSSRITRTIELFGVPEG